MRVADADLLQADEHADAVIDVDDEIADLQIAQVGEKRLGRRPAPLRRAPLLLEDVGFGVDLQAGVGQPEAARQPADGHQHRGVPRVVGALDRNGEHVVLLEQLDRALGAARRRGDEQRRLAVVAQAPDLGDPVGDAAVHLDGRLAADADARQRRPDSGAGGSAASSSSPSCAQSASRAPSQLATSIACEPVGERRPAGVTAARSAPSRCSASS